MSNLERRFHVASLLRELGHQFVAHEMSDDEMDLVGDEVHTILDRVTGNPLRHRDVSIATAEQFSLSAMKQGPDERHRMFSDSIVSGGANPMGLGARMWRDTDTAVMEVTLRKAFEGAPGRSHGGVVAALIDETMGLVTAFHGALAFTARLNINFRAPTPIDVAITARAWLEQRHDRKLTIKAIVCAGDLVLADADALFIEVDPQEFLEEFTDS